MRIQLVDVVPYALPFRRPYVTSRGSVGRREMVILRLRDDDGLIGLGEAVPLSLRGGARLEQVVEELELLDHLETVDEGDIERLPSLSGPARCATAIALLDLRSRRLPAERGTDKSERQPVPCNATLVAGEPSAVAEDALRWAEDGYSTFKLKLGAGDDVSQVRAVREAVGQRARIRVDANGAWDLDTAKRTLSELEPLGIELAEQPVATLEEAVEVAASTSIPIAGDESIETRADAVRAREMRACSLTGIKLAKVGSPEAAVEIAEALPAYISSALDGPIGIAAAVQVAQTLRTAAEPNQPGLAHGLATQRLFASTIAAVECEVRDGMIRLPAGPGLGVEIDEDALRAHRL